MPRIFSGPADAGDLAIYQSFHCVKRSSDQDHQARDMHPLFFLSWNPTRFSPEGAVPLILLLEFLHYRRLDFHFSQNQLGKSPYALPETRYQNQSDLLRSSLTCCSCCTCYSSSKGFFPNKCITNERIFSIEEWTFIFVYAPYCIIVYNKARALESIGENNQMEIWCRSGS